MIREEIAAVLDRRDEGWSRRDAKVLAAPYAKDAVVESPIYGRSTGRFAIEQGYERLLDAWWPLEYTRKDLLVDGNRAVVSFEVHGTHSGEFFRLPPTGKKFQIRGVTVVRLADHQILHERRVYDFTGLLVKLGVLKATVSH